MAPNTDELPTFEIAERRAQYGDLDTLREIDPATALKDFGVPMMTRWVNTAPGAPEGRFHTIMKKGYQQVHTRHLASEAEKSGWSTSPEGFVTRGEKGHEVLVMMPKETYEKIQRRKASENDSRRRSSGAMQRRIAEDLGAAGASAAVNRIGMTEFQETADVRKRAE